MKWVFQWIATELKLLQDSKISIQRTTEQKSQFDVKGNFSLLFGSRSPALDFQMSQSKVNIHNLKHHMRDSYSFERAERNQVKTFSFEIQGFWTYISFSVRKQLAEN